DQIVLCLAQRHDLFLQSDQIGLCRSGLTLTFQFHSRYPLSPVFFVIVAQTPRPAAQRHIGAWDRRAESGKAQSAPSNQAARAPRPPARSGALGAAARHRRGCLPPSAASRSPIADRRPPSRAAPDRSASSL